MMAGWMAGIECPPPTLLQPSAPLHLDLSPSRPPSHLRIPTENMRHLTSIPLAVLSHPFFVCFLFWVFSSPRQPRRSQKGLIGYCEMRNGPSIFGNLDSLWVCDMRESTIFNDDVWRRAGCGRQRNRQRKGAIGLGITAGLGEPSIKRPNVKTHSTFSMFATSDMYDVVV